MNDNDGINPDIYYYLVMDIHPFIYIIKKTNEGWYFGDTILRSFLPFFSKTRPRTHLAEENYVLTHDFKVAKQWLDRQVQEWKQELMSDFHLLRDARDYLRGLREYNKEVSMKFYLTPDDRLIYFRTILNRDRSWKQEIGILGSDIARRSFTDNDLGSERPMRCPGRDLRPITEEIARYKGEQYIDSMIAERVKEIEEFCEVI